ncbi:PIG-L family deacetylase [Solicola sp. PLA-1-18]|uniref:PIG-L family deacetylase n=1 Tax=Solicola sp. PLA-1-18 TaxID=3380532 RepID=UPI003B808C74
MPPTTAYTLVSFHAHPDDEALLTGGTLARAAAEGHRVVLVTATAGEAGLAARVLGADRALGGRRLAELDASARALGVARVVCLGFADSGWHDSATGDPAAFSAVDPRVAARALATVLREEDADVLTTYDPAGGYGHPDHVQVHRVGEIAAELAGTPSVLQATVDRDLLARLVRLLARVPGVLDRVDPTTFETAFTPRAQITHRVDVRHHLGAKRASLAAHASQATSDSGPRTLRTLLALPRPLAGLVLGVEWFVDRDRRPGRCDDVFATVRAQGRPGPSRREEAR